MLTDDKAALRHDKAALESALKDAGATIKGKVVQCPFHEDSNPSASIFQGDDGDWRFQCHAAACGFHGDVFDVIARSTGKTVAEVLRERCPPKQVRISKPAENLKVYPTRDALRSVARYQGPNCPPLELECEYDYTNPATGTVDMVIFRLRLPNGDKTFRQGHPVASGFVLVAPPKPWPVYNRKRLLGAKVALVLEGEKCVHTVTPLLPDGTVATTAPGGAGSARHADWSPLRGKEVVYLWPDLGDAGDKHMREVAAILGEFNPAPELRWIDPETVGLIDEGDDVVDFLEAFGGDTINSKRDALGLALASASPLCASADLHQRIEDAIAGKFSSVALPWSDLSKLTKAIMPGTVTLLCGDPGATKSFLLMQAVLHWLADGVKVALYELEEDRAFWLTRALAILAGKSSLTDPDWMKANATATRAAYATLRTALDAFSRRLFVAGEKQLKHAELLAWIRQQAEAGCRVICVDPVTALEATDKPWIDDLAFVMKSKAIAGRHGCSLIFVTHPRIRRGKAGSPLDDLAGGAAYVRFAQTVLWVNAYPQGKQYRWRNAMGICKGDANRSVKIAKARNGAGGGLEVVFDFDGATLRFSERGVVTKEGNEKADDK